MLGPKIQSGQRLLIVAHGNSLRALIKHIDSISDKDIINLNLPTGAAFVVTDPHRRFLSPPHHSHPPTHPPPWGCVFVLLVRPRLCGAAVPLVYELNDDLTPIKHPDASPGVSGRFL